VSVRTARNSLTGIIMLRHITLHQYVINLYRTEISPEQCASKIVKISQQMAKLCQKLKWLVFFWDTV